MRQSEQERHEREEIEKHKNVKRLTEGFKPAASSCRDERSNLVTDAQGMLRLCRHYFSTLLRGDGEIKSATRDKDSEAAPIDDDGVEMPPPNHNESCDTMTQKQQGCSA